SPAASEPSETSGGLRPFPRLRAHGSSPAPPFEARMRSPLPSLALCALLTLPFLATFDAGAALPAQPGHVFVIVLENKGFSRTFGPNGGSPYLAHDLVNAGLFLPNYYGTGHASLDNYISMVSGQGPNPQTQADCPSYTDFVGVVNPLDGQAIGQGCVYPAAAKTIGDQLSAAGKTWRMYGEDMAASPQSAPTTCRHAPLNAQDPWEGETSADDQYATKHVPFVYFHSVIDDAASCSQHVVDLDDLNADLQSVGTTPNLAFITPNLCSDGHDSPCSKNATRPGGYAGIEQFLRAWVPRIEASPAYQQDGRIVIVFDEGDDNAACCGEQSGYDTPMAGEQGAGGGQVGAVVLGPCIAPGRIDT